MGGIEWNLGKCLGGKFSIGPLHLSKLKGELQINIKILKPETVTCWTFTFVLVASDKNTIQISLSKYSTVLVHGIQERKKSKTQR